MTDCLLMLKKIMKKTIKECYYPFISVVILFLVWLLRASQGLNLSDDGFVLTAYNLVFVSPGSISYMFLYYWLINIGGVWNVLFGSSGIYAFRVLECLVLTGNVALVWVLLRNVFSRGIILAGVILVFMMIPWVEVFEYNTFSAFVSLTVIVFMMKSFYGCGCKWMFIAGLVSGLNVFVRIPNACMCMLVIVIIPYYWYTKNAYSALKLSLLFLSGIVVGILSTIAYMSSVGHLAYFMEAFQGMMSLAGNEENSHGIGRLLYTVFYNNAYSFVYFIFLSFCPLLYLLFLIKSHNCCCGRLCCVMLLALHVFLSLKVIGRPLLLLNSSALVSCLYVAYVKRCEPCVFYLSSFAFAMSVFLPLGSDGGVLTIGVHNLWLAMPFIPYALSLLLCRFTGFPLKMMSAFVFISACIVGVKAFSGIFAPAYYEHGTRFDDVYRVTHPLCNVFTDVKTAGDMDKLLAALSCEVNKGDTVLFAGNIPMLHYLTGTCPYLRNPWPWIFGYDYFSDQMGCVQASGAELPVVVCKSEDYSSADKKSVLLRRFLYDNRYDVIYDNAGFMIFVPLLANKR